MKRFSALIVQSKACDELGLDEVSQRVRCELYKMLLYRTGDFFAPHVDNEKEEGMFGTLVITLPSEYEGTLNFNSFHMYWLCRDVLLFDSIR